MPQIPIPDDWAGADWTCQIIEWPDSEQWLALLRGFMSTAARGRFWDARTGTITDAQAIGLEIERRNPVASCDELIAAVEGIQAAVENLDVSQDLQVAIQTDIVNEITTVASAVALSVAASLSASQSIAASFAWSQSLSQSFVGVKVINNVTMQIRELEPGVTPPPAADEETPTGIESTTQSTADAEICKRAFWVAYSGLEYFQRLLKLDSWLYFTVLGAVGALGDLIGEVANLVTGGNKILIIPASILLQIAHTISRLQDENELTTALDGIVDGLTDVDEVACNIYDKVKNDVSTLEIQDYVINRIISVGGINAQQASLARLVFNLNTLAALYYTSPLLGAAPAVLAGFDSTCQNCLE